LVLTVRAVKEVRIRFKGRETACTALFDSGPGITAIQRNFFEKHFGSEWSTLDRPLVLFWINGNP